MVSDPIFGLLAETLSLWDVRAAVEPGELPVVACVRAGDCTLAWIERAPAEIPFRWLVRSRLAGEEPGSARERRPRACASLVGVLSALRGVLGADRGSPLRVIAPSAPAQAARVETRRPALDAAPPRSEATGPIPVSVITGFLGSGKTTLLGRLLHDPAMGRTAVIVNEFGAVALDHDLIEASDESFVQLSNGCLCCNVRSDLVLTLSDLAVRRAAGTVPPFERVVIETSGLADPAPILHALMTDRAVCEAYALAGVVTTVDAVTGLATLDQHEESLRQAAVADRIVLTKTDIPGAQGDAIARRLARINPGAPLLEAVSGAIAPSALFGGEASARRADMQQWLAAGHSHEHHLDDITSVSLVRDEPVRAATLALFLSALAENCGPDLLRMKGIVHVAEEPERPAVVHGVQHVYHAPVWLERWPSDDRRTRMVFIGRRVREPWVRALLDVLDAEVADETARREAHA